MNRLNIRVLIGGILCVLFLFGLIQWLVGYLAYGKLHIKTSDFSNTVSVTAVTALDNGKGASEQKTGSSSFRLKSGEYIVSVQNGTKGVSRHATIKARHSTSLTINLPKTTGMEPVTYGPAQNLTADSSQLLFLNPRDSNIYSINSQNTIAKLSSSGLQSISWADTGYGIGQSPSGDLFVVDGGSTHPLTSPMSGKSSSEIVYAIAPNKTIYIGAGSEVYRGTEDDGFKKIYSNRPEGSFLLANNNGVAVLSSGYTGPRSSIAIVGANGENTKRTYSQPFNAWSGWSPGGKYFMVMVGSVGKILDSSLREVGSVPQSANLAYPVWLNDRSFFYSVSGQLWSYDRISGQSRQLANTPLANPIKEIAVSKDGSYVYLVSFNDSNEMAIRRVGLNGQRVPDYIYKLQSILPQQLDTYSIGIVNFGLPPVILVKPYPYEPPSDYLQKATKQLQKDGFDTNKMRFQLVN